MVDVTDHVFIAGPASWNRIVYLDRLPEPVPHMQFALDEYETVGGTSAGKALGLAGLGRPVVLYTLFGDDVDGERVRGLLESAGVTVLAGDGRRDRATPQPDDPGGRAGLALPRDADDSQPPTRPSPRRWPEPPRSCSTSRRSRTGSSRSRPQRGARSGPTSTTTTAAPTSTGRSSMPPT